MRKPFLQAANLRREMAEPELRPGKRSPRSTKTTGRRRQSISQSEKGAPHPRVRNPGGTMESLLGLGRAGIRYLPRELEPSSSTGNHPKATAWRKPKRIWRSRTTGIARATGTRVV